MVIVIYQTANTQSALLYNEEKVKEGVATYFHSGNTESVNPFLYDHNHRLNALLDIEAGKKIKDNFEQEKMHIHPKLTDTNITIYFAH